METSRYLVRGRVISPSSPTRLETSRRSPTNVPGTLHVTRVITRGCLRTGTFASHNCKTEYLVHPNERMKIAMSRQRARPGLETEARQEKRGGGSGGRTTRGTGKTTDGDADGTDERDERKARERDDRRRARARRAAMAMRTNSKERAASWSTRPRLLGFESIDA